MNPIPIPKDADVEREGVNKVFGAPDGSLIDDEIRPIEVKINESELGGVCLRTYWRPDSEDIESLQRGAFVELTIWADHLHPIDIQVWK